MYTELFYFLSGGTVATDPGNDTIVHRRAIIQHKVQVGMSVQRSFKSVCAPTHADQNISLPPKETMDRAPIEDSDQHTQADLSLQLLHLPT